MCAPACGALGFPGGTNSPLRRTRRGSGRLLGLRAWPRRIEALRIARSATLFHALHWPCGGPRRCWRLAEGDRCHVLPIWCSRHLLRRAALLRRRCKLRGPRISLCYRPRCWCAARRHNSRGHHGRRRARRHPHARKSLIQQRAHMPITFHPGRTAKGGAHQPHTITLR